MKARTHLTAPGSSLHRFSARLSPGSSPIRILAECSMDAVAQVTLRYSPTKPWELVLLIDGSEVGLWEIEPQKPSEPPPWPSSLSPTVRARVVGL